MVLYSKAYQKYDAVDKRGEYLEEHEFPNKFWRSSKCMEADEIMKMVEDLFYYLCFIIDAISSNDDIIMQDGLNNISKKLLISRAKSIQRKT